MSPPERKIGVVLSLGTAQTVAWASSYYLPAILATPIAAELKTSDTTIYAALSGALIVAGLMGPRIGHVIDRVGGRGALSVSNLAFAAGLIVLSQVQSLWMLAAAWLLLGLAMGAGLYEAAFAALTRLYGAQARSPITGITLIAGFASTVGWPITAYLDARFGWRTACLVWTAAHLLVALPLNLLLPRHAAHATKAAPVRKAEPSHPKAEKRAMAILAYVFAATAFVSTGMAAVLPSLLLALGATSAAAVFAAALVGPAQVLARIVEASTMRRVHPLTSTRVATVLHVIGVAFVGFGGPFFIPAFTILYGAGNGIITISRGSLPLALFGPEGFGRRVGVIAMPARICGALAPVMLGYGMQHLGTHVLWISAALSVSALIALGFLGRQAEPPYDAAATPV
jgi:predicted MFS family arabinose efflux permease